MSATPGDEVAGAAGAGAPGAGYSRLNPFGALRGRDFRFVLSSQVLSLWGAEMETLVLASYVLTESGSPVQVGLIGAARFGGILLGPVYGAVVDRFDRRAIMLAMRGYSLVLAVVFTALVLGEWLELWHAYALVSAASVGRNLGIVANDALTADSVGARDLSSAMGLMRASLDFSRIVGSLLGGALLASIGLGTAYVTVTGLYVAATAVAFGIAVRSKPLGEEREPYIAQVVSGFRYVKSQSVVAGLLFYTFLTEFTVFPLVNDLMPVMARDLYGLDADGAGVMRSVASGGALAGSIVAGAFRNTLRPGRTLILATVVWHLITLVIVVSPSYGFTLLLFFAWGIFGGVAFVMLMVGLLTETPGGFRGRVLGLRALAIDGLPLGLLMGGWLSETFSVETMLIVHGAIGLGMVVVSFAVWPGIWGMRLRERE